MKPESGQGFDLAQLLDAAHVHDEVRREQALLHRGDKVRPAGQDLQLAELAIPRKVRDRLLDGARTKKFEGR